MLFVSPAIIKQLPNSIPTEPQIFHMMFNLLNSFITRCLAHKWENEVFIEIEIE